MKLCRQCNQLKERDAFYPRGSTVRSWCRECTKRLRRDYSKTDHAKALAYAQRRTEGRYASAKRNAKTRNLIWTLTKHEYLKLIAQPCIYCDGPLPEAGTGLDRLDNTLGYSTGNVVPCCAICNSVRNNLFTFEEMQILGKTIQKILKGREDGN